MTAQIIPVPLFDLVVFGATGDLTLRKLMPALHWREFDRQMPDGSRIMAVARREMTTADYLAQIETACRKHVGKGFGDEVFGRLARRLTYVPLDAAGKEGWERLAGALTGGEGRARLFYLATSPELFGSICQATGAAGLATPESRVVIEKPIGHDLASAIRLNDEVGSVFGKESVQNLLALRFANSLFETVWNRAHIDHVQITVAESLGLEGRAGYYDKVGALRDMVQNHILQLLCLVAMEPTTSLDARRPRREAQGAARAKADPRVRGRAEDRARAVPGRSRRRRAGAGLPHRAWAGEEQPDRDFRLHQGRDRELALGRDGRTWFEDTH